MSRFLTPAAVVACVVACVTPTSAMAAPLGEPFATKTGPCNAAISAVPSPTAHPRVSLKVRPSGGTADGLKAGDTGWRGSPAIAANGTPRFECSGSASAVTVDWFDDPVPPTSWDGRLSSGAASLHGAWAPTRATFVADITLRSGSLNVCPSGVGIVTCDAVASSTTLPLGSTSGEVTRVLTARDGAPADYTLAFRPLPVAIGAPAWSASAIRPGAAATLSYVLDGDTAITASVVDALGKPVRELAAGLPMSAGNRSFTWDGMSASGAPVADGAYRALVRSADPYGGASSGEAAITVDGSPPAGSLTPPATATDSVTITLTDPSGVSDSSASVQGTTVSGAIEPRDRPVTTGLRLAAPSVTGWVAGRTYIVTVNTTDSLGNRAGRSLTFGLPATSTPPSGTPPSRSRNCHGSRGIDTAETERGTASAAGAASGARGRRHQ